MVLSWPLRIATLGKGGFSLARFMAAQSDGFWYDFSKTDRLFQENVGPTPADDPTEVIGLALSSRLWAGQTRAQVLAAAPELVTNGDFSGGATGWTNASTGTGTFGVSAGAASIVGTNGSNRGALSQNVGMVVGRTYRLTFNATVTSGAASIGGAAVGAGGVSIASGFNDVYISAPSTSIIAYTNSGGGNATLDNISIKEVSRYGATQATTNYKPKFQSSGAAFDGADDYLATTYAAAAGANFVMLPKVTVPSTLSALKVLVGTLDASSYRFYLGITATGQLSGRIGSAIVETTSLDLRNGVHDIGMWTDGTTIFLYADGVIVASGVLTGVVPTSAWNIGALNNNGTPTSFFGGSLKAVLTGRQALTITQANKICAAY